MVKRYLVDTTLPDYFSDLTSQLCTANPYANFSMHQLKPECEGMSVIVTIKRKRLQVTKSQSL